MTDAELIRRTYEMRQAQTRFFRSHDDSERRSLLREAKRLEQIVDKGLRERAPEVEVIGEQVPGARAVADDDIAGPSAEELSA